jgi:hypothetical protein
MMPKNDRFAGRHVVYAILKTFARANGICREFKYLTTQPTAIGVIGGKKPDSR